jgi:hypothetical protein
MKTQILYVELKSGYSDNGPAWIGKGFFSKTGRTIYFNGQIFKKRHGISGNHVNIENGDEYWISGVKLDGTDRHWAGSGTTKIDESIIPDYLEITGQTVLQKNKFKIVQLNNVPAKQIATEIENQQVEPAFDDSIRFKNPFDLSDNELVGLINYYSDFDMTAMFKKGRKEFIDSLKELQNELQKRQNKNYA